MGKKRAERSHVVYRKEQEIEIRIPVCPICLEDGLERTAVNGEGACYKHLQETNGEEPEEQV